MFDYLCGGAAKKNFSSVFLSHIHRCTCIQVNIMESHIMSEYNHFHDLTVDYFATDDVSGESLVQHLI